MVHFAAGCGPETVKPRPLVGQPPAPDAAPADASPPGWVGQPPASDAGSDAGPDAGSPSWVGRPPAADAGFMKDAGEEPVVDGGTEPAVDGGTEPGVDARNVREKLPAPDGGGIPADAGVGTAPARTPVAGDIRITEVLVNPAGQDSGHEWIELSSLAGEPLELGALHVADAAFDVAVAAGVLLPGARLVLGQSADAATNGGAPVAIAYGTRLALNNDSETLAICVGPCADGVVIDRVSWGPLGAAYDGHALVVDLVTNETCPASAPYGAAGDFGTPGAPDESCAAPGAGF